MAAPMMTPMGDTTVPPVPPIRSPVTSVPPRSCLILCDWYSFSSIIDRANLGWLIRTLTQTVRSHGCHQIHKFIMLIQREDEEIKMKVLKDIATYAIDVVTVEVRYMSRPQNSSSSSSSSSAAGASVTTSRTRTSECDIPFLNDTDLASLFIRASLDDSAHGGGGDAAIDGGGGGVMILIASSRPHLFDQHLAYCHARGYTLLFIHGDGKKMPMPEEEEDEVKVKRRRRSDQNEHGRIKQLAIECESATKMLQQSHSMDELTNYPFPHRRSVDFAFYMLHSIGIYSDIRQRAGLTKWAIPHPLGSDLTNSPSPPLPPLSAFSPSIIGCYSIWSQTIWFDQFEQFSHDTLPTMPYAVCAQWNEHRPCSSGPPCTRIHECGACGRPHRLVECRVNRARTDSLTIHNPNDDTMRAFMIRHYSMWSSLLHLESLSFDSGRWRLPAATQLARYHRVVTPAGVVEPQPGTQTLPPCQAIILLDWQNVHVPMKFIPALISSLQAFVLNDRPGLTSIRIMHVVLDQLKQNEIALEFKRHSTVRMPIDVTHVDASKSQMIDQKLTSMMRSEPRSMKMTNHTDAYGRTTPFITHHADLVCLVSGDIDFSSDLSRLVFLGHRVLLIHNSQVRFGFRKNTLWEDTIEFMKLPQLKAYRESVEQKRRYRKSAIGDGTKGNNIRIDTIETNGLSWHEQIKQIGSIAWYDKYHSLLVIDDASNQLFRLTLPSTPVSSSSSSSVASPSPLVGDLTLVAGRKSKSIESTHTSETSNIQQTVHYIVCIDSSAAMRSRCDDLNESLSNLKFHLTQPESDSNTNSDGPVSPPPLVSLVMFAAYAHELSRRPCAPCDIPLTLPFKSGPHGRTNLDRLFETLRTIMKRETRDGIRQRKRFEIVILTSTATIDDSTIVLMKALFHPLDSDVPHVHSSRASCTILVTAADCTDRLPSGATVSTPLSSLSSEASSLSSLRVVTRTCGIELIELSFGHTFADSIQQYCRQQQQQTRKNEIESNSILTKRFALDMIFDGLREVVVDSRTSDIFLCEYGRNRILRIDHTTGLVYTVRIDRQYSKDGHSTPPDITRPRDLYLDSQSNRLWLSDRHAQHDGAARTRLGFFELTPTPTTRACNGEMMVEYRFVEVPRESLSRDDIIDIGSKCRGGGGKDQLIYADEGRKAFCQIDIDQVGDAFSFNMRVLYSWSSGDGFVDPSSLPPSDSNMTVMRDVDSLLLDVDGSYLFLSLPDDTLKRLVYSHADSRWCISHVAGDHHTHGEEGGFLDGVAREAKFNQPRSIAAQREQGRIFISDAGNAALRVMHMVDPIPPNWKKSICKSFQLGTCHLQCEHDKCPFMHVCMACGGPHMARDTQLCDMDTRPRKVNGGAAEALTLDEPNTATDRAAITMQTNNARCDGSLLTRTVHDDGTILLSDGSIYTGAHVNGSRHGSGRLTYPNLTCTSASGVSRSVSGDVYDGFWLDDAMHGIGCYKWIHLYEMYEGEFEYGIPCGFGVQWNTMNGDLIRCGEWVAQDGFIQSRPITFDALPKENLLSRRLAAMGIAGEVDLIYPDGYYSMRSSQARLPIPLSGDQTSASASDGGAIVNSTVAASTAAGSASTSPLLCTFFNHSTCKNGSSCAFRHACAHCERHGIGSAHDRQQHPLHQCAHRINQQPTTSNSNDAHTGTATVTATVRLRCDLCNVNFNSAIQQKEHESSVKHMQRQARMAQLQSTAILVPRDTSTSTSSTAATLVHTMAGGAQTRDN